MNTMKDTLNLYQTSFPMRADLPRLEPKLLARWNESDCYNQLRIQREKAPKFILNDGPPYANGPIHLGHAVNKILKDIIIKSKTLEGFDAPFVPGWDCHGLPIEVQVEKLFGRKNEPTDFRQLCREYAHSQIEIQKQGFMRLGILGSWDSPYKTMDPSFEAQIIRQISSFIQKDLLHSGFKPVHWCPLCSSSLSDAETEFVTKVSHSVDVAFKVTTDFIHEGTSYPLYLIAWTTTPWTLPSNQAVAYHPDYDYSVVLYRNQAYFMQVDRVPLCLEDWGWETNDVQILPLDSDNLRDRVCQNLFDPSKTVPLIPSEHVTLEKGTGLVHTAPDHGPEDYVLGLKFGLKPLEYLDLYGRFNAHAGPDLAGLSWVAAESIILDKLRAQGQIISQSTIEHQYLTCWRHKKPIFYRATAQWFITMTETFKDQILKSLQSVQWHPHSGEARMQHMISTRPDWCISRQRFWGTPLVLVFHPQTRQLHPNMLNIIETVAAQVEKDGLEAWHNLSLDDLGVQADEGWVKSQDTLDVWFDSGCVFHLLHKHPALTFPADLYLEGNDQYRGWFQSSLICSYAHHNAPPYKEVLTHGFLVDPQGKKMSKSLGNVVDPQAVADKHGVDIMRLWASLTNYEEEMAVSESILTRAADNYRRIRNTLKFILANLVDFKADQAVAIADLPVLDRWIIAQTNHLQRSNQEGYAAYHFQTVSRSILDFCVNELGAVYLDIIKDRLYTAGQNSQARRSAQTALTIIFESLVHQLTPILPFTADEAWEHHVGHPNDCILMHLWPACVDPALTPIDLESADRIVKMRKTLQSPLEELRKTGQIGSSLEAQVLLTLVKGDPLWAWVSEMKFIFLVSQVHCMEGESEAMQVEIYVGEKCPRCWHRIETLESTLCVRCDQNIHGSGEHRAYA